MSDPNDPAGPIRDLKARVIAEHARRGLEVVEFGYDPSADGVDPDMIKLTLVASSDALSTPVDQLEVDAAFDRFVAASESHDVAEAAAEIDAEIDAELRRRIADGGDLFDDLEEP